MRKSRFSETQIIGMIKETGSTYTSTDWLWQRSAASTASIGRQAHAQQSPTGSPASFYKLKARYGGMDVSDARHLKQLEEVEPLWRHWFKPNGEGKAQACLGGDDAGRGDAERPAVE